MEIPGLNLLNKFNPSLPVTGVNVVQDQEEPGPTVPTTRTSDQKWGTLESRPTATDCSTSQDLLRENTDGLQDEPREIEPVNSTKEDDPLDLAIIDSPINFASPPDSVEESNSDRFKQY